jgi:2-polyprenyl-6-methoxyphenol hydroxylase-like FAD-dependent oxidoreductase
MIETHNTGFSFQVLAQSKRVFWFLYVKLDAPSYSPARYTDADAEKLAQQYLDKPITSTLIFRQLWESRVRVKLANLEEGMQKRWHDGRIVVVGDAAHKMTSNLGFGFNTGLESAASLTNHLVHTLSKDGNHDQHPDLVDLEHTFSQYQAQRFGRAKLFHDLTNFYTRVAAWDNFVFRCLSVFAMKLLPDSIFVGQFSKLVKGGLKLEFIPIPDERHGTVPFEYGK